MPTNYQPRVKRNIGAGGSDFYPTPAWATRALLHHESFAGDLWEPACGDGAMATVLAAAGYPVTATDLYDHGYGTTGINFLTEVRSVANVVTNPPFNQAEAFVRQGLRCARHKVALLLRLAFLEGNARAVSLFTTTPLARVWVFPQRITFYPKDAKRAGGGTMAYAWYVWSWDHSGPAELRWLTQAIKPRDL